MHTVLLVLFIVVIAILLGAALTAAWFILCAWADQLPAAPVLPRPTRSVRRRRHPRVLKVAAPLPQPPARS